MNSKDMVSFRTMMSTFYLLKSKPNDACMKRWKFRKFTLQMKTVFGFEHSSRCCNDLVSFTEPPGNYCNAYIGLRVVLLF